MIRGLGYGRFRLSSREFTAVIFGNAFIVYPIYHNPIAIGKSKFGCFTVRCFLWYLSISAFPSEE